jgi:hypothetical protein
MPIVEYGQNILNFLPEKWLIWLAFVIVVLAGYCWYWYLFEQRTYKAIDGKLFVRHGRLGKWVEIIEHLREEHHIDTEVN